MNVIILVRLGDTVAPRRPEEEEEEDSSEEEEEEEEEEVGDTGAAAAAEDEKEEGEEGDGEDSLAAFAAAAAASTMLLSTASSRGLFWSGNDARARAGECRLRGTAERRGAIASAMMGEGLFRQRCEFVGSGIVSTTLAAAWVSRRAPPTATADLLVARRQVLASIVHRIVFLSRRRCCRCRLLLQCFVKKFKNCLAFSLFSFFVSLFRSFRSTLEKPKTKNQKPKKDHHQIIIVYISSSPLYPRPLTMGGGLSLGNAGGGGASVGKERDAGGGAELLL